MKLAASIMIMSGRLGRQSIPRRFCEARLKHRFEAALNRVGAWSHSFHHAVYEDEGIGSESRALKAIELPQPRKHRVDAYMIMRYAV